MSIIDYLITFLINFKNRFISIDYEKLMEFTYYNKYLLLFIFITYILIVLDNRFKLINKIFIFIFIIISILLLNMYNYMDLSLFIKELFWYSLILNISFIIHCLYFHWIYSIFWKYRYEKICWIISRIAFIFSLSFLVIITNTIYILYYKFLNNIVENKNKNMVYKIIGVLLFKIKLTKHLSRFITHLIYLFSIILRYFILIFLNYSSIIIGNKTLKDFKLINIIIFISFFIFSYIMSYWILGIPRIIFIWIFFFIIISLELLIKYCINFNKNKPYIKNANIIKKIYYFFFEDFIEIMMDNIEKPQLDSLFNQGGLYNKNYKGNYNRPQYYFLFLTVENNDFNNLKFIYKWIFIYNKSWYSYCYDWLLKCDIDEFEKLLNDFILDDNLTKNEIINLNNLYIEKKNNIINNIFKD